MQRAQAQVISSNVPAVALDAPSPRIQLPATLIEACELQNDEQAVLLNGDSPAIDEPAVLREAPVPFLAPSKAEDHERSAAFGLG